MVSEASGHSARSPPHLVRGSRGVKLRSEKFLLVHAALLVGHKAKSFREGLDSPPTPSPKARDRAARGGLPLAALNCLIVFRLCKRIRRFIMSSSAPSSVAWFCVRDCCDCGYSEFHLFVFSRSLGANAAGIMASDVSDDFRDLLPVHGDYVDFCKSVSPLFSASFYHFQRVEDYKRFERSFR